MQMKNTYNHSPPAAEAEHALLLAPLPPSLPQVVHLDRLYRRQRVVRQHPRLPPQTHQVEPFLPHLAQRLRLLERRQPRVLLPVLGRVQLVERGVLGQLRVEVAVEVADGLADGVLDGGGFRGEFGGEAVALGVLDVDLVGGELLLGRGLRHLLVQQAHLSAQVALLILLKHLFYSLHQKCSSARRLPSLS